MESQEEGKHEEMKDGDLDGEEIPEMTPEQIAAEEAKLAEGGPGTVFSMKLLT